MFFVLFCALAGPGSGEMAIESIDTSFKNKGTQILQKAAFVENI